MQRLLLLLLIVTALPFAAGCDDRLGTHLSGKTFPIGEAERYRTPGVYSDYHASHDVWVVSFGGMVVALADICPRDGEELWFDDMPQQFKCAHCGARFDTNGLPRAPQDAEQSMVRLRIEAVDKDTRGDAVELKVNPRFQFRQEKDEWSSDFSMYSLEGS